MGNTSLVGAPLKKMLAVAKKKPLNFAYCPGGKPADDILFLDRKRKPDVLGRDARAEGEGTKVAFGTAKLRGKILTLTCDRIVAGMAKRLKRWLRDQKVQLNISILDAKGNVVEEDVEDNLPEDPDLDAFDAEDDETGAVEEDVQEAVDAPPAAETPVDDGQRKALTARAAALQAEIKAAPAATQAPLLKVLKGALTVMQAGELDQAASRMDKLEQALAKVQDTPVERGEDNGQAAAPNPMLEKLRTVAEQLGTRVAAVEGPAADRLRQVHGAAVEQIDAGDAKKAAATIKALSEALAKVEAASAADDAPTQAADPNASKEGKAWAAARAVLEPGALRILQLGVGDVSKLRATLAFFIEKGEAGDFAGALKAAPGLQKLIQAGEAAEETAAQADVPEDVVPFVKARLNWAKERTKLKSEMMKLQNAILAVCQGEAFKGMEQDTKMLFSYLEALDDRLETALDNIVSEADEGRRAGLKTQARGVISDYMTELNTPFFQDVDGNNGFTKVEITSRATGVLSRVDEVLSRTAA